MGCYRLDQLEFTTFRAERNDSLERAEKYAGLVVSGLNHVAHRMSFGDFLDERKVVCI